MYKCCVAIYITVLACALCQHFIHATHALLVDVSWVDPIYMYIYNYR